eukprot:TRINITY_DN101287_c0_g1_i1.p1 TRINITY_DN101287_c0_g1~~TRINITY_DN101287_c0_g1_i1.p1  ORF type:complete len:506 (+),score=86.47 TRINITY_DN101287_c0_g1_i1:171-1688(+)
MWLFGGSPDTAETASRTVPANVRQQAAFPTSGAAAIADFAKGFDWIFAHHGRSLESGLDQSHVRKSRVAGIDDYAGGRDPYWLAEAQQSYQTTGPELDAQLELERIAKAAGLTQRHPYRQQAPKIDAQLELERVAYAAGLTHRHPYAGASSQPYPGGGGFERGNDKAVNLPDFGFSKGVDDHWVEEQLEREALHDGIWQNRGNISDVAYGGQPLTSSAVALHARHDSQPSQSSAAPAFNRREWAANPFYGWVTPAERRAAAEGYVPHMPSDAEFATADRKRQPVLAELPGFPTSDAYGSTGEALFSTGDMLNKKRPGFEALLPGPPPRRAPEPVYHGTSHYPSGDHACSAPSYHLGFQGAPQTNSLGQQHLEEMFWEKVQKEKNHEKQWKERQAAAEKDARDIGKQLGKDAERLKNLFSVTGSKRFADMPLAPHLRAVFEDCAEGAGEQVERKPQTWETSPPVITEEAKGKPEGTKHQTEQEPEDAKVAKKKKDKKSRSGRLGCC